MSYIYNGNKFNWDKESHNKYHRIDYFFIKSIHEFQEFLGGKKEVSENFRYYLDKIKKEEMSLEAVGYLYGCPISILKYFLN